MHMHICVYSLSAYICVVGLLISFPAARTTASEPFRPAFWQNPKDVARNGKLKKLG